MADLGGFDASQVEPNSGFDPIPAGKFLAAITESEFKPNKAGTGRLLKLTFLVLEGEYANRLLWVNLNLEHPNATAMKIARGDLSAICRAVGVPQPKDSVELHNLPLVIHVRVKKRTDTQGLVNEVKVYSQREKPAPVAAASGAAPPWQR